MKPIFGALLALLSLSAYAATDSVPFLNAVVATPAAVQQRIMAKDSAIVSVQAVVINRGSFGANIISMPLPDGKMHTFVGTMDTYVLTENLTDHWTGRETDDKGKLVGWLSLSRHKSDGQVVGRASTINHAYDIVNDGGVEVFIEANPDLKAKPIGVPPSVIKPPRSVP